MFQAAFHFYIATFIAQHTQATQVPLGYSRSDRSPSAVPDHGTTEWNMYGLPNSNATSHLVFETVNSLLQRWPNTRMRNGHTMVPGTIPKGTLLYHGTYQNELPPGPEWTATDPEHSIVFCKGEPEEGCWHLTLATTRPLKVVYFDGSSAAKVHYGSMDAQDLIIWGVSRPWWVFEETQRIRDLCKWGQGYGVDAFVRMEVDFELMLCNFTSGVSVVSFSNLPSVRPPSGPRPLLDPWMAPSVITVEAMYAGSWHYHFPGEIRVQLDLAGLVSFYDTELVPSLVPIRIGQERWDHRVQNTSSEDITAVKERLAEALTRPEGFSSGIDWMTLVRVIVDRYAGRLELIQYLLSTPATDSDVLDLARKIQVQLRVMLTPYILHSAVPSTEVELDWAVPIFKLCSTTHTSFIQTDSPSMTPSEQLILQAVRDTTREICRVVTKMWASGVHVGLDEHLNPKELPNAGEVTNLVDAWCDDANRLMAWLDWNVWVKCKPACGPEEMCYLPTWPMGFPTPDRDRKKRRPGDAESGSGALTYFHDDHRTLAMKGTAATPVEGWSDMKPGPDDWIRPQPKCIRRVQPYEF
ncbi:hypothetical protein PAXRUDRAFT_152067 [Paxillus rubicundulus Ve08.2h10]|uniref:Uncharacterized protein n=1 Tax=Paxillus rubicundulus Ve08.2h10 TaxID=930991 RepID=A0A0D0D0Q9_9AGAM|nr:hypothetical protein PAXRUDRAFT_152067 [Paxillus rubicundulus Ve08.2h10]